MLASLSKTIRNPSMAYMEGGDRLNGREGRSEGVRGEGEGGGGRERERESEISPSLLLQTGVLLTPHRCFPHELLLV